MKGLKLQLAGLGIMRMLQAFDQTVISVKPSSCYNVFKANKHVVLAAGFERAIETLNPRIQVVITKKEEFAPKSCVKFHCLGCSSPDQVKHLAWAAWESSKENRCSINHATFEGGCRCILGFKQGSQCGKLGSYFSTIEPF
ncbi:hypothetical protein DSO57_1009329 [Entomophthora muscae]|uniref:Uncharacterized protein n=1 Tax=Entomophthora muscae TaxID=34485 RepID=A0ACC2S8V5_9FUNG|nr:hypothetical protein DSO57_1009329 [Entomophthora muscae]